MRLIDLSSNILDQLLGPERDEDSGEELSKSDAEEFELDRLPHDAVVVYHFEDEVTHSPGLTWDLTSWYFAVPIREKAGNFALLSLDWDDNYGQWDWRVHSGVENAASIKEVEKLFMEKIKKILSNK